MNLCCFSFRQLLDSLSRSWFQKFRSSRTEVFCKKSVLGNFAKLFLQDTFGGCFWNWCKCVKYIKKKYFFIFKNIVLFLLLLENVFLVLLLTASVSNFKRKRHYSTLDRSSDFTCNIGITTPQEMKFSIKDFFSKSDQIQTFLRIWSRLLNKSLIENFIFRVMYISGATRPYMILNYCCCWVSYLHKYHIWLKRDREFEVLKLINTFFNIIKIRVIII